MKTKRLYICLLSLCLFSTACHTQVSLPSNTLPPQASTALTGSAPLSSVDHAIAFETLANDIKGRYEATTPYSFADEVYIVERNEPIEVDLGFPITSDHNTYDMFQFFLDPELTIPLWRPTPQGYYKGYNIVKIKPSTYPLFRTEFEGEAKRENANWGNAGTLYLAKYYDAKGNVTEEPQEVSVVKIKTELPTPNVNLIANEQGLATLIWQPVDGATRYTIYRIRIRNNQISADEILFYYGNTCETSFSDFPIHYYDTSDITGVTTNNILSINDAFRYDEEGDGYGYVVIAEGNGGQSEMSRIITPNDYAYLLPNIQDYDVAQEDLTSDTTLHLPFYFPVKMCDETTAFYPIEYDLNSIQDYAHEYAKFQVEGKGEAKAMSIIGRPKGTPFEQVFHFYYFPQIESAEEALKDFMQLQEAAYPYSSGVNAQLAIQTVNSVESLPTTSSDTPISIDHEIKVTATNPLSEYLAYNLLSGVSNIPLDSFPQAIDSNYLCDAYSEAISQNPLISDITSAKINTYTNTLVIEYKYDLEDQKTRKEAILNEARRIVTSIITTNMTDLEKEEAINAYLCENLEYDFDALASAKKNNYKFTDPEYDDTFTLYGALINKVCVCAGYSAAFKQLADLAGLDALVVTGQLNSVGHAWNKVKIGEDWLTIDPTNNDKDVMPNGLFNLSDDTASLMIIEDKDYVLDANYNNYRGSTSSDSEYYHLKGSYFSKDMLTDILAQKLSSDFDTLTLRTDFDITNEELSEIIHDAVNKSQLNSGINYYSWFGIIHITR